MTGPLAGVRVLDLTRLLPGSYATSLLADLGAEVIKVEQPEIGDYMRWLPPLLGDESAYTWVLDRNKKSISLDLKQPAARKALLRLAESADVFFESFRPGVADRLGLGYETLKALNPRLVYCSLSGYGQDGPLRLEVGHDLNYVGRAGLLSYQGTHDDSPALPSLQIADVAAGSLYSVAGILAALVRACTSGEGDYVDVAMTDGSFTLQAIHLGAFWATGEVPSSRSLILNGRTPGYNIYQCADGKFLTIGAVEVKFWDELCDVVGRPDLRPTHQDEAAIPVWRELFLARTRDEWVALLAGHDVCAGPVNDLAEATADPQLGGRGLVVEQEHPTLGPRRQLGNPIRLREHPVAIRLPFPRIGEHTRETLLGGGLDTAEVDALLASGAAVQA